MRALIVGIDSQIGSALALRLRTKGIDVVGTSRRKAANGTVFLDLLEPDAASLPEADIAFLCAAATNQKKCRNDPEGTRRINVDAPVMLAKRLSAHGTRIVFASSNAVFDGRTPHRPANDAVCPITIYGHQKAEAERRLLDLDGAISVVRLTKTLTLEFSLVRDWIANLKAGRTIDPFIDMVMAPMPIAYVVDALLAVATSSLTGIFQASGLRDIPYSDAARHVATRLRFNEILVVPIPGRGTQIPANEVPANTTLDPRRVVELMGSAPPDPLIVIDEIIDHVAAKSTSAPDSAKRQAGVGL